MTDMRSDTSSAPTMPGEPKSSPEASPAFLPALNASLQILLSGVRAVRAPSPVTSDAGSRKYLKQPAQSDDQREPVFVPQHSDAMRHVLRRLLEKIFVLHRIRSNHLVRGDPDPHVFLMVLGAQRSDHDVLREQPRPSPLGHGDVDQRHNHPAQIENSQQMRGA